MNLEQVKLIIDMKIDENANKCKEYSNQNRFTECAELQNKNNALMDLLDSINCQESLIEKGVIK